MIKLSKVITLTAVSLLFAMSGSVFAADGAETYIAKGCGACHGVDAKTPVFPLYPKIVGQSKEYFAQQMKDIKSGARNNSQSAVMKGIMASVSNEEINAIAEYLSNITVSDSNVLDIDGDSRVKPLTDGLLVLRYLFGFTGDSLVNNALGDNATRSAANDVEAYLQSKMP